MRKFICVFICFFSCQMNANAEDGITHLHKFEAGKPAVASEVNDNFNHLEARIIELEKRLSVHESENSEYDNNPDPQSQDDPLIGIWSCESTAGQVVEQWFLSGGSMNDALFSCWVSGWERNGGKIIVHRSNCSDLLFTPAFTNENNTLTIDEATYFNKVVCTRKE